MQKSNNTTIQNINCNIDQQKALDILFEFAENKEWTHHLIIPGGAGVGKSVLLKIFRNNYPNQIRVAAFTGKVAFDNFGDTLHATFKLPIKGGFMSMNSSDEKEFIDYFKGIRFLFIDEYSMIPAIF